MIANYITDTRICQTKRRITKGGRNSSNTGSRPLMALNINLMEVVYHIFNCAQYCVTINSFLSFSHSLHGTSERQLAVFFKI